MNYKTFLRPAKTVAGILLAVCIVGCGGSGVTLINTLLGNYSGSGTLHSGKNGALTYTVNSNGTVSGTFTVTGTESTFSDFNFKLGAYTMSGLMDALGRLNLKGSIPGEGDFEINGTAPEGSATSGFTVSGGSTSYTGSMKKETATATGSLVLSDLRGANCSGEAFVATPVVKITNTTSNLIVEVKDSEASMRSLNVVLGPTATAGKSIALTGMPSLDGLEMYYSENPGGVVGQWLAKSGTLKIVSRSATSIELELTDAFFGPDSIPGSALGTFVINGKVKK